MRLLPEVITELDPNIRWEMAKYLRIIEEVVLGPKVSDTGAPTMEETFRRMGQAVVRKDKKAEDAAITDYMRAEVRAWWQDFPEQGLLTDLYQRAARRRAKSGSPDSRRPPSHEDGLQVAKALLADFRDTELLDALGEADTVARVLAGEGLVTYSILTRAALRMYKKESRTSLAHFDALRHLCAKLDDWGWNLPRQLARWRQEVEEGRRRRPAMKPIPARCPLNPDRLRRDMHLQFVITVLERVGVRPQGVRVSGCRIVAEASGLSEGTVERIWKACTWRTSFLPAMRKYAKDISIRHGPFPLPRA